MLAAGDIRGDWFIAHGEQQERRRVCAVQQGNRSKGIWHDGEGVGAEARRGETKRVRHEVIRVHVTDFDLLPLPSLKVHNNAAKFPPFLLQVAEHLGLASESDELPLPPLSYHSHWITPRSVVRPGKRFSAHFFLTALEDSMPETQRSPQSTDSAASKEDLPALALSADGSETLSLKVAPVQHYIRAAMQDEILLYPPQFYILSDIYATTQPQTQDEGTDARLARLRPHIFGHREETVTPVEEEPRHLGSRNYAWDRETSKPTGWVSSSAPPLGSQKQGDRVTAVEPRALPKSGSNLPTKSTDEDPPFVFPLVLPGDWQASQKQQQQQRGDSGTDLAAGDQGTTSRQRPINRIFVSPRLKEDGGGLMAKGARREGLPGLCDWVVGQGVPDFGGGEIEESERGDDGKTNRSRL